MSEISVVKAGDRQGWSPLLSPAQGNESTIFESGRLSTGFWEREPDSWEFVRDYDEVALILEGEAEIVPRDGETLTVSAGDVLVTPRGSAGTWRVKEKVVKFWVIYQP
jgi:hypothetical protein